MGNFFTVSAIPSVTDWAETMGSSAPWITRREGTTDFSTTVRGDDLLILVEMDVVLPARFEHVWYRGCLE